MSEPISDQPTSEYKLFEEGGSHMADHMGDTAGHMADHMGDTGDHMGDTSGLIITKEPRPL